jgi:isovaleryl-CoA dehydrogenase
MNVTVKKKRCRCLDPVNVVLQCEQPCAVVVERAPPGEDDMTRNLGADREEFAAAIRAFTRKESGTPEQRRHLTRGGKDRHNADLYRHVGRLGWIGVALPPDCGGSGGDLIDECIMLQELARGGSPVGGIIPSLIVAGTYDKFGSEAQRERIAAIAAGEVHAIAMSEPDVGSDVAAMRTAATRRGDDFVINGQKTWITNAHFADWILVVARTSRSDRKHFGLTMLAIPTDTRGVEVKIIESMGEEEICDVFFEDCVVPASAVVGEVDVGWSQLVSGLERERLMMASQLLGVAQRVFDRVLAYVRVREQFGQTLASFQVVRHRLAEMATEVESCEAFVYALAEKAVNQPAARLASETSMAKLKASEVLKSTALDGIQLMGAYGYASESEMEQDVKIALASTIYGGTSEIQKEIISKELGLR